MKLDNLIESLGLGPLIPPIDGSVEVTGGYCSDLLSDVLANAQAGDVWITLQVHKNIVAVAAMKEVTGIILVNNRKPDNDTLQKAEEEGLAVLGSDLPAFEIAGRLYELGIRGKRT